MTSRRRRRRLIVAVLVAAGVAVVVATYRDRSLRRHTSEFVERYGD